MCLSHVLDVLVLSPDWCYQISYHSSFSRLSCHPSTASDWLGRHPQQDYIVKKPPSTGSITTPLKHKFGDYRLLNRLALTVEIVALIILFKQSIF